jgi:hypothetical protein
LVVIRVVSLLGDFRVRYTAIYRIGERETEGAPRRRSGTGEREGEREGETEGGREERQNIKFLRQDYLS